MPELETSLPVRKLIFKNPAFLFSLVLVLITLVTAGLLFSNKLSKDTPSSKNRAVQKTVSTSSLNNPQPKGSAVDVATLSIHQQMQSSDSQNYQSAAASGASFSVTSDNKSFWLYWKPQNWSSASPKKLIISLGGHDGYASKDFAAWYPILSDGYPFALASLQWWFGKGEKTSDYYTPTEMNKVINNFLEANNFSQADLIVFEGFSRGSANSYAIAALDSTNKYFDFIISNAGGFATDYPPNQDILNGKFGNSPYENYKWILYCGEKDPNPNTDGCPGMTTTKTTIEKYGANVVLFIKDPKGTHGSFMTNVVNTKSTLNLILEGQK